MLVTGASGFLGVHLCERLRTAGAELHAVSRSDQEPGKSGVRWWRGDLADAEAAERLLGSVRPDYVFHLASEVSGARDLGRVIPMLHGNLTTTVNLLKAAVELPCERIVLAGSLEEPDPEQGEFTPGSPYAAAKWASTGYARMFNALYGAPVVNLKIAMVYGPAQRDLRKLIPYVTVSLLREEVPRLGSGRRSVDWTYVDDVIDAFVAASTKPGVEGGSFDVGSGELTSVRQMADELVRLIQSKSGPEFGVLEDRPLERDWVARPERWASLGWAPRTGLEDGLRQTVSWYRDRLETLAQRDGVSGGGPGL